MDAADISTQDGTDCVVILFLKADVAGKLRAIELRISTDLTDAVLR